MLHPSLLKRLLVGLAFLATSGGLIFSLNSCQSSESNSGSSSSSSNPSEQTSLESQVLANLSRQVLWPTVESFQQSVQKLTPALESYCQTLETAQESNALRTAQAAWKEAMRLWQRLEILQLGPLAEDGGQRRNNIYSWPLINACAVDQELMVMRQAVSPSLSQSLVNRKGLAALEYLLFTSDLNSRCEVPPNGWNELSSVQKKAARCTYLKLAGQDIQAQAQLLFQQWNPAEGNYTANLAQAGQAGSAYKTTLEALNHVSDALFYLDDVKDHKLGQPLGLLPNSCGTSRQGCSQDIESPWSDAGQEHLLQNLLAFQAVYLGHWSGASRGPGFKDLLIGAGQATLAQELETRTQRAINLIQALPAPLGQSLIAHYASVLEAHAGVKSITDILKTEFLVILHLQIPQRVGGDTD